MDKKHTMKEYIEREALIAEYDRRYYPIRIGEPLGARKLIENAPTADVVEVKHGKWNEAEDGDGVVCSCCECDFCILVYETEKFNYCPNCGAKMDGERKTE